MKEKIDFVIPWVDGNDEKWLEEKRKYKADFVQDDRNIRYRDWDLLKYWFRGVSKFAPWVNRIHFLTWGHVPEWLNTNNDKINVVKHDDFIPKKYLPTFSSHPIELNMHRIKGLSDNFVYFNDDLFLINKVVPEDFFRENLPCDCLVESAITPRLGEFSSILCETTGVINRHFTKKDIQQLGIKKYFNPKYKELLIRTLTMMPYHHIMGFYNPHICSAFNKKTLLEVWEQEYDILDRTCMHKFRDQNDVSQYLFRYWNLCKGSFYPAYPIGRLYNVAEHTEKICDVIRRQNIKIIAINDADCVENVKQKQEKIQKSFEQILNEKSEFEK